MNGHGPERRNGVSQHAAGGSPAASDIVVVHSSDLHLNRPDPGDPTDGLQSLRDVLDVSRRVAADVLVLAGDIFDHNRQPLALLDAAARLLGDSGIEVVVLPGNHDPLTPDSVYRNGGLSDPRNVHVIGVSVDEAVRFAALDLEVWGRAHEDYEDMRPLRDPLARRTRWQIAVAHGHFMPPPSPGQRFLPAWRIHEDEILATGADYVALGHWDRPVHVAEGPVPAYYSGSPDWAKTVNVARLSVAGGVSVTREPLEIPVQSLDRAP